MKKTYLLLGAIFASLFLLGLRLHKLQMEFSPPESVLLIGTDSKDKNKYLLINIQPDQELSQILLLSLPESTSSSLGLRPSSAQATKILGVLVSQVEVLDQTLPDKTLALAHLMLANIADQFKSGGRKFGQNWRILQLITTGYDIQTLDLSGDEVISATLRLQKDYQPLLALGQSCPITVSNATNRSGLAGDVGNFLTSQGAVVVRTINYPETLANTQVLVDVSATKCFAVADIIAASFTEAAIIIKQPDLYSNSRATIEIRLGESYSNSTSS